MPKCHSAAIAKEMTTKNRCSAYLRLLWWLIWLAQTRTVVSPMASIAFWESEPNPALTHGPMHLPAKSQPCNK